MTEGSRAWKTAEDIDRFAALRLERQRTIAERPKPLKIWAVIPEGVLRQEVGGRACMRAQLEHLIDLARNNPHVTLQVLPFSAGAQRPPTFHHRLGQLIALPRSSARIRPTTRPDREPTFMTKNSDSQPRQYRAAKAPR